MLTANLALTGILFGKKIEFIENTPGQQATSSLDDLSTEAMTQALLDGGDLEKSTQQLILKEEEPLEKVTQGLLILSFGYLF